MNPTRQTSAWRFGDQEAVIRPGDDGREARLHGFLGNRISKLCGQPRQFCGIGFNGLSYDRREWGHAMRGESFAFNRELGTGRDSSSFVGGRRERPYSLFVAS